MRKAYIAISEYKPVIGEHYSCHKFEDNFDDTLIHCLTTIITDVIKFTEYIYIVSSENRDYLVTVANKTKNFWYETISIGNSTKKCYLALSKDLPIEGKIYQCSRMQIFNGEPLLYCCYTNLVKKITKINERIYVVDTLNSRYITLIR